MLLLIARALANSGFAFEGTTVFRWGVATEGIAVFRSTMLPLIARTFANSGFVFEGTTVFRCGITTGGIAVFRSWMLPLIARRRRDSLKSRSTIGGGRECNKFVPVLGGDGTRMPPSGDLFDQSPREMS